MKKINFFLSTVLLASTMIAGCKKDEPMAFKAESAVNFNLVNKLYSVDYSFLTNPEPEFVQEVPVTILGDTTGYDRTFNVEVVNDSVTTATPDLYEIIGGKVDAGHFTGKLQVKLKKSAALDSSTASIKVRIVDSEDFNSGNLESREFVINWTNKIIVPAWSVYLRTYITPTRSTVAFRIFMQLSGLTQFTAAEYRILGVAGSEALGTKYGDYIKQWNKDHPNDILRHDDGTNVGEPIVPLYYTRSKFD
jgi:hypothetical protein